VYLSFSFSLPGIQRPRARQCHPPSRATRWFDRPRYQWRRCVRRGCTSCCCSTCCCANRTRGFMSQYVSGRPEAEARHWALVWYEQSPE